MGTIWWVWSGRLAMRCDVMEKDVCLFVLFCFVCCLGWLHTVRAVCVCVV